MAKLVHDVTQVCYKELHATIDSLTEAEPEARRERLLEYVMRTRHRIARLLVAVKWFMDYSGFHESAMALRDASTAQSSLHMTCADGLWASRHASRNAASLPPALAAAAEILSGNTVARRLPEVVTTAIGLEPGWAVSEDDRDRDATMRLGTATREFVRTNLAAGLAVEAWRKIPQGTAVRIGVPFLWSADVLLDSLSPSQASLRILRLSLSIEADVDAPGPMRASWSSRAQTLQAADQPRQAFKEHQELPMRQMIEDRVRWAAEALPPDSSGTTDPSDSAPTATSHDQGTPTRGSVMFETLRDIMSFEIAVVFAMDHIRAQSSALVAHPVWRKNSSTADNYGATTGMLSVRGVSATSAADSPVAITYWAECFQPSTLTFTPRHSIQDSGGRTGTLELIAISHDPPILGCSVPPIELNSINVEKYLLDIAAERTSRIFHLLGNRLDKLVETPLSYVQSRTRLRVSLAVQMYKGAEIEAIISLRTGAARLRLLGGSLLDVRAQDCGVWEDYRQFRTMDQFFSAVSGCIRLVLSASHAARVRRLGLSCDLALSCTPPPCMAALNSDETSALETLGIEPPFAALERYRVRSFVSFAGFDAPSSYLENLEPCSSPEDSESAKSGEQEDSNPAQKRRRVSSLRHQAAHDKYLFVRGRKPFGIGEELHDGTPEVRSFWQQPGRAASSIALTWVQNEATVRRDRILQFLLEQGVLAGVGGPANDRDEPLPDDPFCTPIKLVEDPLAVASSRLLLRGNGGWRVHMTLLTEAWDDFGLASEFLSYARSTGELVFNYPKVSRCYLARFCNDMLSARAMCLISHDLATEPASASSPSYSLVQRNPTCVRVEASGLQVRVSFVDGEYTVEVPSTRTFVREQVAPLIEEVVNASSGTAGVTLAGMLTSALPLAMALDRALPEEERRWQLRFSSCLKARLLILGTGQGAKYAIELDVRGQELDVRGQVREVVLTDYARALAIAPNGNAQSNASNAYRPVPRWDVLIQRLASLNAGIATNSNTRLRISLNSLSSVLAFLLGAAWAPQEAGTLALPGTGAVAATVGRA